MQSNRTFSCVASFSHRLFFVLSCTILLSGAAWGASTASDCYEKNKCEATPLKLRSSVGTISTNTKYQCRVADPAKESVKFRFPDVGTDIDASTPPIVTTITEEGVANNGVAPPKKGKFLVGEGKCGTVYKKGPAGFTQLIVQQYDLLGNPAGDPGPLPCGYSLRGAECLPPGG